MSPSKRYFTLLLIITAIFTTIFYTQLDISMFRALAAGFMSAMPTNLFVYYVSKKVALRL